MPIQDIDLQSSQDSYLDGDHESDEDAKAQFFERRRLGAPEALADTRDAHWPSSSPLSSPPSTDEEADAELIQRAILIVKPRFGGQKRKSLADTLNVSWLSSLPPSSPTTSEEEDERETENIQHSSRSVNRERMLDELLAEVLDESRPSTMSLKGDKEEGDSETIRHPNLIVSPKPRRHAMESLAETLGVQWSSSPLLNSPANTEEYESSCSGATLTCVGNLPRRSRRARREVCTYRESPPEESPSKRRRLK